MAHLLNLCFHGIGSPQRVLEPGEDRYWVSTDDFRRVLDAVRDHPDVRISFDDGNASDVEIGLSELQQRGLHATFFLLAGRMDQPGSVSSAQARELAAAGMGIGTHGMDHRPWRGLSGELLRRELVEARDHLAEVTGRPIGEAALPLGRYDRRLLSQLRRLGYSGVHTSDRRWAREGQWVQPRFSIRATDTVESVRSQILTRPSLSSRLERGVVTTLKRLR